MKGSAVAFVVVALLLAVTCSTAVGDKEVSSSGASGTGKLRSTVAATTASDIKADGIDKWIEAKIVSKSSVGQPVKVDDKVMGDGKHDIALSEAIDDDPAQSKIGTTLTTTLALVFVIGVIIAGVEFVTRLMELSWLRSKNLLYLVVFERVRKELCILGAASLLVFFFTDSKEVDRLISRLTSTALNEPTLDLTPVWDEIHLAILFCFVVLPIVAMWLTCCAGRFLQKWILMDWTSTSQYSKGSRKRMVQINRAFVLRHDLRADHIFLPFLTASATDTMGQIFNIGWVTWMDVSWIGLLVCIAFRYISELEQSTLFVDGIYVGLGLFLILWQCVWKYKARSALHRWLAAGAPPKPKKSKVEDAEGGGAGPNTDAGISDNMKERSRDAVMFLWFKSRRLFLFGICENVVFTIIYLATLGVLGRKQETPEEWLVFGAAVIIGLTALGLLPSMINKAIVVMATGDPNITHFTKVIEARKERLAENVRAAEEAGIRVIKPNANEAECDIHEESFFKEFYDEVSEHKKKIKDEPFGYAKLFSIVILKEYWLGHSVQKSTLREYAALFHTGVFDAEVQMKNIRNFVIAMVGILLMVAQLQVAWDGTTMSRNKTTSFLKFMMMMDSILLVIGIVDYYALQQRMFLTRHFVGRREFARKVHIWNFPDLWLPMLFELLVCGFHPFPFTDLFTFDDKWSLLMFIRLYLFVRIIRDTTYVHRNRNFIKKAAEKYGKHPAFNWALSCKILYHNYIGPANLFLWAVAVLVLSYCVYVCEREEQPEIFQGDGTMFYFTAVTMTTVGYGDISPKSRPGRVMAIIIAFTGIILTSLFTAVVTNQLELNEHQMFARDWVARDQLDKMEPHMAQTLIKETWRSYIRRNRNKNSPAVQEGKKEALWPKFKPKLGTKEGMTTRLGMKPAYESRSIALSAQMASIRQKKANMESMMADPSSDKLDSLETRFAEIEKTQAKILELLQSGRR